MNIPEKAEWVNFGDMSRRSGKKRLDLSWFRAYRGAVALTRAAPFGRTELASFTSNTP